MLYDILPPTILIVSVSGIVVILARGMARAGRVQFTASIQSAQHTPRPSATNDVLRPNQKSVQAIRSRATLVTGWLAQARASLTAAGTSTWSYLRHRLPRQERLKALGQQAFSGSRTGLSAVRSRLRRRATQPQEPNIDALFAPVEPSNIRTRVVDSTPDTPAATTPVTPLHALRRQHLPKKKITPLQRAQTALQEKHYQHAEDILVDYIVHHTKDAKAYMLLGRVAMAKANWAEGMEIFEQVVALRPTEPGAQAGLGLAAYNVGRYAKALPALQRAHEEDPTNLSVLNDLLSIAQKMDNPALQRSIQSKLNALTAVPVSGSQVGQRP